MPISKRVQAQTRFSSSPNHAGATVRIDYEEGNDDFGAHLPVEGEIIQSFEIADTPGGWHLVWLDEAFDFEGERTAHLMIASRWVARPIVSGQSVPVHIRLVPDVSLVQKGAPDIEKLPLAAKGTAELV